MVEFQIPAALRDRLFAMQHKPEEGVMSMGLGDKAGRGPPLFNEALLHGHSSWRVVLIKRSPPRHSKPAKQGARHRSQGTTLKR